MMSFYGYGVGEGFDSRSTAEVDGLMAWIMFHLGGGRFRLLCRYVVGILSLSEAVIE